MAPNAPQGAPEEVLIPLGIMAVWIDPPSPQLSFHPLYPQISSWFQASTTTLRVLAMAWSLAD